MASEGNSALRIVLQVVLAVAVVGLSWILYQSISEPWARYQERERETERVRVRMDNVRTGLIEYNNRNNRFPGSLDSLVAFIQTDSSYQNRDLSTLFRRPDWMGPFVVDSLPYSPRSGRPFEYAVNDTSEVKIYYLADPDNPADYIGSREPDPARRNAASWE